MKFSKLKSIFLSPDRRIILMGIFMLLGFVYRLYMASLYPHIPSWGDENLYLDLARNYTKDFWFASTSKPFVYPLFLDIVFKLFGGGQQNLAALTVIQALIDTSNALLVFAISQKLFKVTQYAWFTFIAYLANPLTATYSGLVLSEILAIFLLLGAAYVLITAESKRRYLLFGLFLGLFVFIRIMFFYWSLLMFAGFYALNRIKKFKNRSYFFLSAAGFVLMLFYASVSNMKRYNTVSPLPILSAKLEDIYCSIVNKKLPSIASEYFTTVTKECSSDYLSAMSYIRDNRERYNSFYVPQIAKANNYIKSHPFEFIYTRFRILYYLWSKTNLYHYGDPFYPGDKNAVNTVNWFFLTISAVGFISFVIKKFKNQKQWYFTVFTVLLLVFLTIPMMLFTPEERHTIPAYSILLLFFPPGISKMWHGLRGKLKMKVEVRDFV